MQLYLPLCSSSLCIPIRKCFREFYLRKGPANEPSNVSFIYKTRPYETCTSKQIDWFSQFACDYNALSIPFGNISIVPLPQIGKKIHSICCPPEETQKKEKPGALKQRERCGLSFYKRMNDFYSHFHCRCQSAPTTFTPGFHFYVSNL